VLQLLGDTKKSGAVRQAARNYVEIERSWPRLIARYDAVYAKVLEQRCAP